ncbi:entericidin EcnAB [Arcobacteraceae bacterium]|nr:entericidin EcnAB [Arcobacteraceae bacterium]
MKNKILRLLFISIIALVSSGCATWDGIKKDTGEAYDATKEAIHDATK